MMMRTISTCWYLCVVVLLTTTSCRAFSVTRTRCVALETRKSPAEKAKPPTSTSRIVSHQRTLSTKLSAANGSKNSEDHLPSASKLLSLIVAATSIACSCGVFWSEVAVFQTGCGPLALADWLERSCYLGVLVVSGASVFIRIVFSGQQGLASVILGDKEDEHATRTLLQLAEGLALLAVAGAVVVVANQVINNEAMDGLSGIDLDKCRARQSFEQQML